MAVSKNLDLNNIKWVQWENKRGVTTAHAVDPDSVERTGVLRTLSGSVIPEGAATAADDTPRDHFSVSIIDRVRLLQDQAAKAAAEKKAQADAREAAKAERAAVRAQAREEAAKARAEKAAKKAAEKAERAKARAAEAEAKKARPKPEAKAKAEKIEKAAGEPPKAAHIKKTKNGKNYEVRHYVNGVVEVVGTFPVAQLEGDPAKAAVSVTDKVWVVLEGKKRVAYGKRES
jgi:type II secretory ATPase GspE/PulE/Tfp pilus assembly ATPase PilB-like protein